jgi:hypothetical protein
MPKCPNCLRIVEIDFETNKCPKCIKIHNFLKKERRICRTLTRQEKRDQKIINILKWHGIKIDAKIRRFWKLNEWNREYIQS